MSVHNSLHNSSVNSDHDDEYVQDPDPVTRISKLDISDPLHLHPNDTIALTVVSIKLKGTKNYQVWSCAMLLALEGKNKIGFIDGTCKRSNTDEVLGKQLPSSVLNVKSPYEMIYKKCPTLSHLRVFGCLCFATIVNNSDKFGSRSEKCVMIGYYSVKKDIGAPKQRRSSRQSVFPRNYNDFVVDSKVKYGIEKYVVYSKLNTENFCFVTQLKKNHEPKSFLEASKYPHWTDGMNQEMDALLRNGTWEIVELPKGRKAIESKWIYKIKYQSSGEIDRFKARLVAQGFGQKEGIDYEETFPLLLRWLLLDETVYMKPPEGYFPSGKKVFRLKKSLYGLKQAPRQWNAKLTSTLIENGFSQSKSDYFLYTKSDKGVFLALLVYVDDIIITGNNVSEIEKFKVYLKSKFMIKDLGKLKYFLGIEIVDTEKGICLNQRKYATEKDHVLDNITDYQKLMGKLIYLTNTRPDIFYVVHCLSQFMHSPLKSHLKTAFQILRYLKGYPDLGIHIVKDYGMSLTAFFVVDWAKCVVTRKFVTGYCVFLNSSLVSWKTKKQKTLSKSSTEAEYRALASVTSEVIWVLKILKDLNIENLLPVKLHCDSNSAIKTAANPVFHERTKHLEIDLHFVREKILKGVFEAVKLDSANQIADILTKGLDTFQHKEFVENLGLFDIYQVKIKGGC
ncbi:ribonuclease H-like domain-containing protein [Tanacetum coccineum]